MSLLKEIRKSGHVAWSPSVESPDVLAVGTIAGSVDEGFSSGGTLELFKVSTSDSSSSIPSIGSTTLDDRFHKLAWGQHEGKYPQGIIAGGMGDGSINLYDPVAILASKSPLIATVKQHSGPVGALDFNPHKSILLASGGADSEVRIWDLSDPSQPKASVPTQQSKPTNADITAIQWNKKVSHILASTTFNGSTVVWDLRAKKSVVTFTDPKKKSRCRAMAWHPDVATQISVAYEDDSYPVVQVWDLRNAFSPAKSLEGHTKGIWSISWCPFDSSLLLSSATDNQTVCWDTNTGSMLCKVESGGNWNIDVQWSPRLPAILSTASLAGRIRVYSLTDPAPRATKDAYSREATPNYSSPPKWLKPTSGVAFAFGGKLLSFGKGNTFQISNIVTEPEFVARAEQLELTINNNACKSFCEQKAQSANNEQQREEWNYMRVLFENARAPLLHELGFSPEETAADITKYIQKLLPNEAKEEAKEEVKEKGKEEEKPEKKEPEEEKEKPEEPQATSPPSESKTEEAQTSNVVDVFGEESSSTSGEDPFFGIGSNPPPEQESKQNEVSDIFGANPGEEDPFAAITSSPDISVLPPEPVSTQPTPAPAAHSPSVRRAVGTPIAFLNEPQGSAENILTRALIVGNFESAVDCCLKTGRMADALVLAACGGAELWGKTQDYYFAQHKNPFMKIISSIFKGDLIDLVSRIELANWKGMLALLCTYAKSEEFPSLCDALAARLEEAGDQKSALLCFICACNVDKVVAAWIKATETKEKKSAHAALSDLIEKATILRCAVEYKRTSKQLSEKFCQYAEILASQGCLDNALKVLSNIKDDPSTAVLLDRLYNALPNKADANAVPFPFVQEETNQSREAGEQKFSGQVESIQSFSPEPEFNAPNAHPTAANLFGNESNPEGELFASQINRTPAATAPSHQAPGNFSVYPTGPSPVSGGFQTDYSVYPPVTGNVASHPPPDAVAVGDVTTSQHAHYSRSPVAVPEPSNPLQLEPSPSPASHQAIPQQSAAPSGGQGAENVIAALTALVQNLEQKLPPTSVKKFADARTRLEAVFTVLRKQQLPEVEASLLQFVQAFEAGDMAQAQNIYTNLANTQWNTLGSTGMLGIRRLIQMRESIRG